jgi:kynureninase
MPHPLDAADPLARFADLFARRPGEVYLDGNSLGLLCRPAEESLREAVETWRELAIRGWTEGPQPWFGLSRKVSGLLAPLLGAEADDVTVGQTTTVNLHQLLATFHDPGSDVLIDRSAFPSDRYAVESRLRGRGELVVADSLPAGVGFAVLPAVVYTTGQLLDLRETTAAAREAGTLIAWDCSHSAGVVPHRFRADDVDLAFGCTYKWLNGGPGSVGWLYVHPRLRDRLPGLAGWFGCDPVRQFEMADEFHPAADAGRYLIGTPHVLSLAPLLGSLRVVAEAGVEAIRTKSLRQTAYLREQIEGRLGLTVVTPREDDRRGGHLTLSHPEAGLLSRALRARGVVPDFRRPDLLRLAPAPLYTSFAECDRAIDVLEDLLTTGAYRHPGGADAPVT